MSARGVSTAPVEAAAALARRLGMTAVSDRTSREAWSLGGVVPALVARPADVAELAATVATVAGSGATLVPLGGGTHRALGQPPLRYDLALVTDRLQGIRDYTPADMTVTVEAGATIGDLAAVLAREKQWLPLEPPLPATTTVGGLLAADLAGPLAGSQGRVRDFVIGIGVVTAAGVAARAGGRVVKNVAGYDLMKLFIGSLGTLAVVTHVTFKVRPQPEVQRGLVFRLCGSDAGFRFASAAAAADLGALAVTVRGSVRDDAQNVRVSVRLAGVAADLAAAVKRLVALASSAGAALELDAGAEDARVAEWSCDVRDFPVRAPGDLVVRLATLPSRLAFLTAAVGAVFHGSAGTWQADAFRGTLLVAVASARAASVLAALTRIADTAGARLVVERWPLDLAATIVVWHPLPPAFPLMERMKRALDPQGVFAAGRFVGGL